MFIKTQKKLINALETYKQGIVNGKKIRDVSFENKIMAKIREYKNYSNVMKEYERRKEEFLSGKSVK